MVEWLAEHIVSSREVVKRENLELRSMVIMTLHCANGEREERNYLEAELTMAKELAVKGQESLSKLQESLDLL